MRASLSSKTIWEIEVAGEVVLREVERQQQPLPVPQGLGAAVLGMYLWAGKDEAGNSGCLISCMEQEGGTLVARSSLDIDGYPVVFASPAVAAHIERLRIKQEEEAPV